MPCFHLLVKTNTFFHFHTSLLFLRGFTNKWTKYENEEREKRCKLYECIPTKESKIWPATSSWWWHSFQNQPISYCRHASQTERFHSLFLYSLKIERYSNKFVCLIKNCLECTSTLIISYKNEPAEAATRDVL